MQPSCAEARPYQCLSVSPWIHLGTTSLISILCDTLALAARYKQSRRNQNSSNDDGIGRGDDDGDMSGGDCSKDSGLCDDCDWPESGDVRERDNVHGNEPTVGCSGNCVINAPST